MNFNFVYVHIKRPESSLVSSNYSYIKVSGICIVVHGVTTKMMSVYKNGTYFCNYSYLVNVI